MFIEHIPLDKLRHSFVGSILCISYFITEYFQTNHLWALGFCAIISAGREIQQKIQKKGTPEIMDFVYTMIVPLMFYIFTLIR